MKGSVFFGFASGIVFLSAFAFNGFSGNPVITPIYTADPAALVYGDSVDLEPGLYIVNVECKNSFISVKFVR
jgi:hypothetical protein